MDRMDYEYEGRKTLGKYGEMRRAYLEEHHPFTFDLMLMEGTLWRHLFEVEVEMTSQVNQLIAQLAKQRGINEQLKEVDPIGWAREMQTIKLQAEEILLPELIYTED